MNAERIVAAVENALRAVANDSYAAPSPVTTDAGSGVLISSLARIDGAASGWNATTVFEGNAHTAQPVRQGFILVANDPPGPILGILNAESVGAVSASAAAVLAARILHPAPVNVLTVLGADDFAATQVHFINQLYPGCELRIARTDPNEPTSLVSTSPEARFTESFEAAVRGSDLVFFCTDRRDAPVVSFDWLLPGTHVNLAFGYQLVDQDLMRHGRFFTDWLGSRGPNQRRDRAIAEGAAPVSVASLSDVIRGSIPGRHVLEEITVHVSTGSFLLEVAAGRAVVEEALKLGLGSRVSIEGATEP